MSSASSRDGGKSPFAVQVTPDWEGFVKCIRAPKSGGGAPSRVHHIELFLDGEIQQAICERYGVLEGLDPAEEFFAFRREIALQRFLGYDFVRCGVEGTDMPLKHCVAEDTAELAHEGGRSFTDEHEGPITNRDEFEAYPWPDPAKITTRALEWYQENLPDDMCLIGGLCGHFAEYLCWLMGYETLCFSLYDQRDLVEAISRRLTETYETITAKILAFSRVKLMMGSDDMGFRTGTMISPDDLREFVLPGHRLMARMSHEAGRPYLLHSCGNLKGIMEDLIEDVKIDAKHSFEDTIEDVRDLKETYGKRIALIGGIDQFNVLTSGSPETIRNKVRELFEKVGRNGGYICSASDHFFETPVENLKIFAEAARECTY